MTLKTIVLVTALSMAPVLLVGQGQPATPPQGRGVQRPPAPPTAKPAPRPGAGAGARRWMGERLEAADVLKRVYEAVVGLMAHLLG